MRSRKPAGQSASLAGTRTKPSRISQVTKPAQNPKQTRCRAAQSASISTSLNARRRQPSHIFCLLRSDCKAHLARRPAGDEARPRHAAPNPCTGENSEARTRPRETRASPSSRQIYVQRSVPAQEVPSDVHAGDGKVTQSGASKGERNPPGSSPVRAAAGMRASVYSAAKQSEVSMKTFDRNGQISCCTCCVFQTTAGRSDVEEESEESEQQLQDGPDPFCQWLSEATEAQSGGWGDHC